MVPQDQAFAFGPEGIGEAFAFFFREDDPIEFLSLILVSS